MKKNAENAENAEKCGKMRKNGGKCGEMRENAEKCGPQFIPPPLAGMNTHVIRAPRDLKKGGPPSDIIRGAASGQ